MARCKETVEKQGYHLVSAGRAWRNRGQCDRKAGPGGYCWQHQPARDEWHAELNKTPNPPGERRAAARPPRPGG